MDVAPYQVFEVDDEKTYNLYIWIDETGIDQSAMMGQTFKATIKAEGETYYTSPESDFTVTEAGVLTAYNGTDTDIFIPNSVTSIGDYAFAGCGLTNISIPNSVTSIGTEAFSENSMTNVFIPNSVTTIGEAAFAFNNFYLSGVIIPSSVTTILSTEMGIFRDSAIDLITVQGKVSAPNTFAETWNRVTDGSSTETYNTVFVP
ncbi:MAG: leucine-rich repeat domain-containing protein [Bacilli bacterium]|nr:leucine-rich repeat domain-containing protein [Bacilli bacterium]